MSRGNVVGGAAAAVGAEDAGVVVAAVESIFLEDILLLLEPSEGSTFIEPNSEGLPSTRCFPN
jgi:hypothetical protein